MDFRYCCLATELNDEDCDNALVALLEFHQHKLAIMDAAARVGKGGKPIVNWYILKLELLQSVIPNIQANSATIQFSADITEHAHITEIKNPAQAGNNQGYEVQICRDLDHTNKIRCFDLAAAICDPVFSPHSISSIGSRLPPDPQQLFRQSCNDSTGPLSLTTISHIHRDLDRFPSQLGSQLQANVNRRSSQEIWTS